MSSADRTESGIRIWAIVVSLALASPVATVDAPLRRLAEELRFFLGCLTMVDVKTGKKPMSWKDYQAGLASGKMKPIPAHH